MYLIEHEFEVLQIQYMEVIQDVIVSIHMTMFLVLKNLYFI